MMDLRIRIRNKNTIEWTDIYTEMPIMRESYKLKETPTPEKGVFYEDKNKNETIIGGSDTIEMSLNQENIIKVHINDLDSKKNPYPIYGIAISSSINNTEISTLDGEYSVYGSDDDNHYQIIHFKQEHTMVQGPEPKVKKVYLSTKKR